MKLLAHDSQTRSSYATQSSIEEFVATGCLRGSQVDTVGKVCSSTVIRGRLKMEHYQKLLPPTFDAARVSVHVERTRAR